MEKILSFIINIALIIGIMQSCLRMSRYELKNWQYWVFLIIFALCLGIYAQIN